MTTYIIDPTRSIRLQLQETYPIRPMAAAVGTALYRFFDPAGNLLYVGVTSRPRDRWHVHSKRAPWWPLVASVSITDERMKEVKARRVETAAIHSERPLHNVAKTLRPSSTPHGGLTEGSRITPIGKGREGNRKGSGGDSFQDLHLHRHLSDAPTFATAGAGR